MLKNSVYVDAAVALVFWDGFRRLVATDPIAARALYEMSHGNYLQQGEVVDRLAHIGYLNADRDVLSAMRDVIRAAVELKPDSTLAIGLPINSDNVSAVNVWAAQQARLNVGFADLIQHKRAAREGDDRLPDRR